MTAPAVVGIDLGGTNVRAGLVADGRLHDVRSVPVRSRGTMEDVLEDVFGAVDAVMRSDVAGIGAGVPSVIDLKTGTVYDVQNIPSWTEVPLKARLEERYRRPACVNNDANAFAAGEKHFGKIRPYDSAVGLIVGTGLGAGIIANGRLYSGTNCGAGEFGMLPYLDRNFEAYASGQFFERVHGDDRPRAGRRGRNGAIRGPSGSSPSSAATSARPSRPSATPSIPRSSSSAARSASPTPSSGPPCGRRSRPTPIRSPGRGSGSRFRRPRTSPSSAPPPSTSTPPAGRRNEPDP